MERREEWIAPDDPWDEDGNYDPSERLEYYSCSTVIIADANGIVVEAKDADPPFFTDCWQFMAPWPRGTPSIKERAKAYRESQAAEERQKASHQ